MYLYTNAIALQQRHSSTNTLKTRNGHYHWIYTGNRTMRATERWLVSQTRTFERAIHNATDTPNTNMQPVFVPNSTHWTTSSYIRRAALACVLLSNVVCRIWLGLQMISLNAIWKKKNGKCDGAKMLDWQIMICFSLEMWWYFIDSTSRQKLKKYALAPNSTNRLTIISDEFF